MATTKKASADAKPKKTKKSDATAVDETKVKQTSKKSSKKSAAKTKKATKTADSKKTKAENIVAEKPKKREPQMVTVNGQKVTHGHIFQATNDETRWYFTARLDGQQLKPMRLWNQDYLDFKDKNIGVKELMEKYYPTKLQKQLSPEEFKAGVILPNGQKIEKFNVYKEKDPQSEDFGKYRFYAQVEDKKMSASASFEDLNAYFDRTQSPADIVARNFGEKLQLAGAYDKYKLPEGVDAKNVRIVIPTGSKFWVVYADMGEKGKSKSRILPFEDGQALFKNKIATREQIAAKNLGEELKVLLNNPVSAGKEVKMKV